LKNEGIAVATRNMSCDVHFTVTESQVVNAHTLEIVSHRREVNSN
jgi:hypothetical protein